jgi:glycerol-3-phosphate dehydrogenase (NAD(P)+)
MVPKRIGVLGAGKMGITVFHVLKRRGHEVRVWDNEDAVRAECAKAYGRDAVTDSVEELVTDTQMIFLGVPAPNMLAAADAIGPFVKGSQIILHAARGVGKDFLLPHQAIRAKTCLKKIGVLGGPLYFEDLSAQRPLTTVLASRYGEVPNLISELTADTQVRLHTCSDVVGVEIAGAISNVSALAAGLSQGLELGDTAQGVLLTHGLSESARLGVSLGAEWITFTGLAGVGDLIPRRVASTERHYDVGRALAQGSSIEDILKDTGGSVEGVVTATEAHLYAQRLGLSLPLIESVHLVLSGQKPAREAIEDVLNEDITLGRDLFTVDRAQG